MTVSEWLDRSQHILSASDIATAHLDCLVLIEDTTGKERAWLLAHPEYVLHKTEVESLNAKIKQRIGHVPLAYIRGKSEFYGREYLITPHTLVPRPETETMIDLLKSMRLARGSRALDVGTGSGCIAISAALESQNITVSGCDIDMACIKVAAKNAKELGARVTFFVSDLLGQAGDYEVLLANLPYVPDSFQINTAATHEPQHALFGGSDGLDIYQRLFAQIKSKRIKPHCIFTESLPLQHGAMADIAESNGYALQQTDDFIQLFELV
jgi:release factor glutamine methyltransferase